MQPARAQLLQQSPLAVDPEALLSQCPERCNCVCSSSMDCFRFNSNLLALLNFSLNICVLGITHRTLLPTATGPTGRFPL